MHNLDDLAQEFVTHCVERGYELEQQGLKEDAAVMFQRGFEVANTMDGEGDVFYCTYWRYESESFGVDFEQQHGDTELMFGGV